MAWFTVAGRRDMAGVITSEETHGKCNRPIVANGIDHTSLERSLYPYPAKTFAIKKTSVKVWHFGR